MVKLYLLAWTSLPNPRFRRLRYPEIGWKEDGCGCSISVIMSGPFCPGDGILDVGLYWFGVTKSRLIYDGCVRDTVLCDTIKVYRMHNGYGMRF